MADLDRVVDDENPAGLDHGCPTTRLVVLQPLEEIGALMRERGVLFHTDAAQAVGKIPIDVEGAKHRPSQHLRPQALWPQGGRCPVYAAQATGTYRAAVLGRRSGTLPSVRDTLAPPLVVGIGEACAIAGQELEEERGRLTALRHRFLERFNARVGGAVLNGSLENRLPGNISLRIEGVDALALIDLAPDLAFSTGSACTSDVVEPSHVLRAIGLEDGQAGSSIRLGPGPFHKLPTRWILPLIIWPRQWARAADKRARP